MSKIGHFGAKLHFILIQTKCNIDPNFWSQRFSVM